MDEHRHRLPLRTDRERVLAAVAEAAEAWGATWQRSGDAGHLRLPVAAGLRRGVLSGQLRLDEDDHLVFAVDESHFTLHVPSVGMLLLAAAGGLGMVVGPFFAHRHPSLVAAAPLAFLLAVGGWFVVVANQRLLGAEDFLKLVEELATEPPPADGEESASAA
ncbi:MAG: hypothetical protein KDD11_23220 [Acidobacteria bacterium]|nr:hypothetical protein [Acidobacteriota bacterium]